ncbi:hypothetical protein DU508_05295 [Pedobacter chinensis]|uniref:F5/8 type C domain-containing protein n=1 Tax=Pedobacter chinensis TaxID=2282421 RepID=A0A369Q5Z8_9SPHI|nr:discoidin domain-containing protein [Pedobacter chinensis]RDC58349.1 hypothetical protein DU508_05295 [Pedobacter chinensis]
MKIRTLILCLFMLWAFSSCKKSDLVANANQSTEDIIITPHDTAYVSNQSRNLNLIYFVPNDLDTLPAYEKRLSELMLWTQTFFSNEMHRNGYGYKTFGLFKDSVINRVKIITIRGTLPKTSYPYTNGASAVQSEINAYFSAHPTEKTSDHTLVIIPRYSFKTDGTPSGGPFYGLGKWCFALDYEGLDIENIGKSDADGNRFSVWFGGLVHELGHGLNLPHNCQKVSENATLGMALMWAGNGTLGKSPTFLTAADCAILNVNQIFNNDNKTYYGAVTSSITRIYADYSPAKSAIVVSGKFSSNIPINSVAYYNDPNVNNEGTGTNKDYNATTWESKVIGTDSFYVEMPIAEFKYKDSSPYEMKVKLVAENGTVKETLYNYKWVDALPVLEFGTKNEISKVGWSIAAYSSQQTTAPATSIIDNNTGSGWHSQYSVTPAATYPHYITIDMGTVHTVKGFTIQNGASRPIKNADILYSNDGITFIPQASYVIAKSNTRQNFTFPTSLTFRYFKIVPQSSWDGQVFAQIAEIGFFND